MTSRRARTLLFAVMSVWLVFSAPIAQAQGLTKIKLSLDWRFEGQVAFVFMARFKGYFEQEGLDVTIDAGNGSAGAFQRIASGAYDAALGDTSSQIEYLGRVAGPLPFQSVYMIYDQAPLAFFVLRKSGIRSVKDFTGRTMVESPAGVTKRLWPIVARSAGVDPDSVKFVMTNPALRSSVVLKGDAEIASGFYSVPLEFTTRGVKAEDVITLPFADYGIRLYGNSLLVSTKLIESNPKAVAGLVRGFNRAMREALADPAAAVKFLKQRDPIIDEALELERFRMIIPAMLTERSRANGLGAINKLRLEEQVDQVAAVYELARKPNPDTLFNSSFLPARSERMPLGR